MGTLAHIIISYSGRLNATLLRSQRSGVSMLSHSISHIGCTRSFSWSSPVSPIHPPSAKKFFSLRMSSPLSPAPAAPPSELTCGHQQKHSFRQYARGSLGAHASRRARPLQGTRRRRIDGSPTTTGHSPPFPRHRSVDNPDRRGGT